MPVQIRFSDVDQFGHMNNSVYFSLYDLAKTTYIKDVLGSVRDIVTGADPVLASTRLGRILFWLVAFTMLYILLVFAFWGLFIY